MKVILNIVSYLGHSEIYAVSFYITDTVTNCFAHHKNEFVIKKVVLCVFISCLLYLQLPMMLSEGMIFFYLFIIYD